MNLINYFKQKFNYKTVLLTITSLFFLFIIYYGTMAQVSRPELCTVCHMMKPQFYSWQASSHEKVPCLSCHEPRNIENQLKTLYSAITNTYMAPIIMTTTINDRKCEKCHKVNQRNVTPSGDLIIPHASHKDKKIACAKCHRGVAHGHISERRVTYKSDYGKWDPTLAKSLMTDDQTRPLMDTCMRCHEVRKAPLDCKACHRTTMLPESHKAKEFKFVNHGQAAAKDLQSCNKCHSYMSSEKFEGFKEIPSFMKLLDTKGEATKLNSEEQINQADYIQAQAYAKINTYCKDCHAKRPPSHDKAFGQNHGNYAGETKERCMTCHDNQLTVNSTVQVACASCHPSSHYKNFQWKRSHPIPIPETKPRVKEECLQCHVGKCLECHK